MYWSPIRTLYVLGWRGICAGTRHLLPSKVCDASPISAAAPLTDCVRIGRRMEAFGAVATRCVHAFGVGGNVQSDRPDAAGGLGFGPCMALIEQVSMFGQLRWGFGGVKVCVTSAKGLAFRTISAKGPA